MDDSRVMDASVLPSCVRKLRKACQNSVASSIVFFCALLLVTANAHAWDTSLPTAAEARGMPPYCYAKLFEEGAPTTGEWYRKYPDGFGHIHHFCYGLGFLNRSFGPMPKHDKTSLLNAAVGQMDYVISHAQPTFKLLSDVYFFRAQALRLLNRNAESLDNLNRSLKIEPTQARTYLLLAEILEQTQQKKSALETVTEGLRYAPQSKGLQRRYEKLGGKLPYPDPIEATPVAPAQPAAPAAPEPTPNAEPVATEPAPAPASAPAEPVAKPKIGSDKNPYCRFCPD